MGALRVLLGFTFLTIAMIGVFLPLLPTTPFLLLASFCFVRSSPRMHDWLQRSPLFGRLLRDWSQHRGVRLHVKIQAITVVMIVISLTIAFAALAAWQIVTLVALGLVGIAVIARLPVIRG